MGDGWITAQLGSAELFTWEGREVDEGMDWIGWMAGYSVSVVRERTEYFMGV